MTSSRFYFPFRLLITLAVAVALSNAAYAGPRTPSSKLGAGLRQLAAPPQTATQSKPQAQSLKSLFRAPKPILDKQGRVLVEVYLAKNSQIEPVKNAILAAGGAVKGVLTTYRQGVISAYIPANKAASIAAPVSVQSVMLATRPFQSVGAVTSQGTKVIHSDVVNNRGVTGNGITVGIMSDSWNVFGSFFGDTAADDVATGDLPNNTSISGGEGLKFLIEGPADSGIDEGRAMGQIVHDVAPGASLCFATDDGGQVQAALNMIELRTNPACNADVITDDFVYLTEPFFSDGILAQVVDLISTSKTLPGKRVSYYSSAGNNGASGYASDMRFVPDAAARGLSGQAVDLSSITTDIDGNPIDTAGGFQDFNPGKAKQISQLVTIQPNTTVILQWDDPFDVANGVTTDLSLLLFDATTGKFIVGFNDDNFATQEPVEGFTFSGSSPAQFRVVIARSGAGSHKARRLKYIGFGGVSGEFITQDTPVLFGHSGARSANSIGAYVYDDHPGFDGLSPQSEDFTSRGPLLIAIDANGNRLPFPEIRPKPDFSAPDGVNTTFFLISDYEADFDVPDGFPNFFGTSAASPHAAAVGALLLEAAGGPGSLSPAQVSTALRFSPDPRDVQLFESQAFGANGFNFFGIVARGDAASADNTNFFTACYLSGRHSATVKSLTINGAPAGIIFDPDPTTGFPITPDPSVKGITLTPVSPTTTPSQTLTVGFGGFRGGSCVQFGVDRDLAISGGPGFGGNSADFLAGATFEATLSNSRKIRGTFFNTLGLGYRTFDGTGLINAARAVRTRR